MTDVIKQDFLSFMTWFVPMHRVLYTTFVYEHISRSSAYTISCDGIISYTSRRKRRHLKSTGLLKYHRPRDHIVVVFHIRISYRFSSLSFHDNMTSNFWCTIWPKKSSSKVKVKGTPVSVASSRLIIIMCHIRASYRLTSLSFHDNRDSHSRDTMWPWKFKVEGQGQRSRSKVP